jgi:phage terminase large subunit-like protein
MTAITSKAYLYCKENYRKKTTPRYVKLQMREFMSICEGKNKKYKVSVAKIEQIEGLTKLLIMPKGLKAGQTLYKCSEGYQWLVYTASLAVVYRDNPHKRRYENIVLEICRKNYKTFTIATIFIILMITEPRFSQFYSVAPDGALSREIREAISAILKSSPLVYKYQDKARFKILRDYILFNTLENKYTPLNYSNSTLDGKLPSAFCADEVGALPNSYAIEAMRSGQLNILNKLGFIISTKYPTINNPFEDEVSYSKKVLDGIVKDETIFSLLYEPDNIKNWATDDLILKQANPVALNSPEIWADLLKKRNKAIAQESARENFVTKHCNIIYSGAGTETYISLDAVQECRVPAIEWAGRVVYIGLDLSESGDNTSVSMLSVDENNNILADSWAFIPEGRIEEKEATERVRYRELLKTGKVIACGDKVIDYKVVEDFILSLEKRLGVQIQAVGYDRWNALSSAQKLTEAGLTCVEVRQHSSILHPPTKLLKEKILSREFAYTDNTLYELNFLNARCTYDTNKNLYVNKKKSTGKIDMVVSSIDAMYLLQQDYYFSNGDGFTIQVI